MVVESGFKPLYRVKIAQTSRGNAQMDGKDEVYVLVVDDVDDAAQAMALALELNGYVVQTACDGAAALAAIRERKPHCVLLDIDMPGIDGCELSKLLRQSYGDDIVLVAVTGGDEQTQRVAETFARVDHYLSKPVDFAVLKKLLPPLNV